MLRRVMASRIENCCTPSLPGGTRRSPTPLPGPPNARGAQLPRAAAPAAPAAAPRNFRRLMLWSMLISFSLLVWWLLRDAGAAELDPVEVSEAGRGTALGLAERQVDPAASAHRGGERTRLVGEHVVRAGRQQRAGGRDRPRGRIEADVDEPAGGPGGAVVGEPERDRLVHVGEREPVVERDPVARVEPVAVLAAAGVARVGRRGALLVERELDLLAAQLHDVLLDRGQRGLAVGAAVRVGDADAAGEVPAVRRVLGAGVQHARAARGAVLAVAVRVVHEHE